MLEKSDLFINKYSFQRDAIWTKLSIITKDGSIVSWSESILWYNNSKI